MTQSGIGGHEGTCAVPAEGISTSIGGSPQGANLPDTQPSSSARPSSLHCRAAVVLVIAWRLPVTRWRRPDEPPEMARQLRLIVETDLGCHV
jgi:hypothetical protein